MLAVPVEAVCKEVVGIPVEVVGSMLRIPGGIFFYWSASPMHGSVDWLVRRLSGGVCSIREGYPAPPPVWHEPSEVEVFFFLITMVQPSPEKHDGWLVPQYPGTTHSGRL